MTRKPPATAPSFCGVCTGDVADVGPLALDASMGVWACARCLHEPVRAGGYSFDDSAKAAKVSDGSGMHGHAKGRYAGDRRHRGSS